MSCNRPIRYTSPAMVMRGFAGVSGPTTGLSSQRGCGRRSQEPGDDDRPAHERTSLTHFLRPHVCNRPAFIRPPQVHAKLLLVPAQHFNASTLHPFPPKLPIFSSGPASAQGNNPWAECLWRSVHLPQPGLPTTVGIFGIWPGAMCCRQQAGRLIPMAIGTPPAGQRQACAVVGMLLARRGEISRRIF
jgi:hypothetical protein